ncbi:winged helix-turn-helix domain-containing protein [Yersinia enterocolitica]|nr:transcriptional regulator [Yersinia enterocolitica]
MNDIIIGDIVFTPLKRTLNKGGGVIKIRNKESEVLSLLCFHYPDVLSREDIEKKIWSESYVTDNTLTQTISNLRHALNDKKHELVTTIPKKGYCLGVKPNFTANDSSEISSVPQTEVLDSLANNTTESLSKQKYLASEFIVFMMFCVCLATSFNVTSDYYQIKITNVKNLPITINIDEIHDKDFLSSYNKEPYVFLKKQKNNKYTVCKLQRGGITCKKK